MKKINVTTKDELDILYGCSALTLEGVREEDAEEFMNWIKERTKVMNERVYIIKGNVMNEIYNLTGTNAYNDDFNIMSVRLDDINPQPIILKRSEIGCRWFDDIVDNNARCELNKRMSTC